MAGAGVVAMRGDRSIAGDIPYKDFPVRKPPMHLFMSGGIVAAMGTSTEGVRFVLAIFDALEAIVLLFIGTERYSDRAGDRGCVPYRTLHLKDPLRGLIGGGSVRCPLPIRVLQIPPVAPSRGYLSP